MKNLNTENAIIQMVQVLEKKSKMKHLVSIQENTVQNRAPQKQEAVCSSEQAAISVGAR